MLKLKDFEGWVFIVRHDHDPPKGRQDTGIGRLASVGVVNNCPLDNSFLLDK